MKQKMPKILFILSFIPYLLILIIGIKCAFNGITFIFNKVYGWEGFVLGVFSMLITFTLYIPIIPICLIFQIFYIFRKKIKIFKNVNIKKYIKACLIIGISLIVGLIVCSNSFEISRYFEKQNAKKMISNAEEKIGFNKNDIVVDGIFNMSEFQYSHILIDYDKVEIGMLINGDINEFWKVKLKKTSKDSEEYKHIINDYFMQADVPLNYPGKRLISFYNSKDYIHRTIAFLLIYEDGTIYFVDNIKENNAPRFTGLQWSEFFVGESVKYND